MLSINRLMIYIFISIIIFTNCGSKKVFYSSPVIMPGVDKNMNRPGFWITHHPYPDKVILNSNSIKQLNNIIKKRLRASHDIFTFSFPYSGNILKKNIDLAIKHYKKNRYYNTKTGDRVRDDFYNKLIQYMSLTNIPEKISIRFGLISHYADQRIFPTEDMIYEYPENLYFDKLQNSALDVGTPVAILHNTFDTNWSYVIGPSSSGWVYTKYIAECRRSELKRFVNNSSFLICTRSKGEIFFNHNLKKYYDYTRMGTILPFQRRVNSRVLQVMIPFRNKKGRLILKNGYVKSSEFHKGYLKYTPRNIIEQAFEMLHDPYGWGGMYGEQDCSKFIQQIYATVGIKMPRNSSAQARVGKLIGKFDKKTGDDKKIELIKECLGGISIWQLNGHIMLYLGEINNSYYLIHSTATYQEEGFDKNISRVINRVVVTDHKLGKGTEDGSYLKRLLCIRNIQ